MSPDWGMRKCDRLLRPLSQPTVVVMADSVTIPIPDGPNDATNRIEANYRRRGAEALCAMRALLRLKLAEMDKHDQGEAA